MKLQLIIALLLLLTACEHSDRSSSDVRPTDIRPTDVRTSPPAALSRVGADTLTLKLSLSGDINQYSGSPAGDGVWAVALPIATGRTYQFTASWYSLINGIDVLVMEQTGQFFADPETMNARPVTTDTHQGEPQFDIDCDGASNLDEINQGSDPTSPASCSTEPLPTDENSSEIPVPVTTRLPADCFPMGSPEGEQGRRDDEILHEVCVSAFSIGVYEVTFDEYDAFASSAGVPQESPNVGSRPTGRFPLMYITFNDAVAYTAWLSEQTGKTYRLPTEVEWEYAARAGTITPFWTGSTLSDLDENFRSDDPWGGGVYVVGPRGATLQVGSLRPNQFGLYDMLGNVAEWTCTYYLENDRSAENVCDTATLNDPDKPYVIRGANYQNIASWARAAQRSSIKNLYRDFQLGFRVVLED